MKNISLKKLLVAFLLFFALSCSCVYAQDEMDEDINKLPHDIREDVLNTLKDNEKPIESKINDGVVMTKEEFNNYLKNKDNKEFNISNRVNPMSVPKDGYIYLYDQLYITSNLKKPYFRFLGEYSVRNNTSSKMKVSYKQQSDKTVTWNVAGEISGNTNIGNDFIAKASVAGKVSLGRKSTIRSGTELGGTATCLPKYKVTITAYQGGLYAKATTVYSKYHKSGGSHGKYTESVSGTAVRYNSYNVKVDESRI